MCFNHHSKSRIRKGFFIFLFILLAIFGLTALVMNLWNYILPDLLHVNPISFWKAMGLLILCKILFGGFRFTGGRGHMSHRWKDKFMHMSPEEKEAFRNKMKERWGNKS